MVFRIFAVIFEQFDSCVKIGAEQNCGVKYMLYY